MIVPDTGWGASVPAAKVGSGTLLQLAGAADAVSGVGQGLQPRLGDRVVALLALAERAVVDAVEGLADLLEGLLLVLHQAEGELLLEVVGPQVRHVDGRVGEAAAALAAGGA